MQFSPPQHMSALIFLFVHVSLYIPLREAVLASSDGDGISESHAEPINVVSELVRFYPRCTTVTGLKIASFPPANTETGGINIFVQFLPVHWTLEHQTEALVYRNFPADFKGDLTRLLMHYLEEFAVNLTIDHTLIMVPVLIQPSLKRSEWFFYPRYAQG